MLPSSHALPMIAVPLAMPQHMLLADAFSEFIAASTHLELSYRDLQKEVAQLGIELADRNAALQESLSENQAMRKTLQRILDSMPCGVLVVNVSDEITLANPEAYRLLDIAPEQMRSAGELSTLRQIDLRMIEANGSQSFIDGEREQELAVVSPGGKRWIAVRRQLVYLASTARGEDAERHAVITLHDVSAQKRAESERESTRNAMALAEMSTVLAHEIRNPLTSLELFAGLLVDCPEQSSEWISHLRAGTRSLTGTVNNVLSLYGGSTLPMERLNLEAEVRQIVDFIQPMAREAGVRLLFQPAFSSKDAASVVRSVRGNRSALQQMLLNLAGNAFRHSAVNGAVVIEVRFEAGKERPCAQVLVSDTGCGISPDLLGRIFDGGFSGSGQTPGLGLTVCRRLLQQHDGSVTVASRVGEGSTFTLEFPTS